MTYTKRARTTTRRIRIRRIRVAGPVVVIAAIASSLGYLLPATSTSTAASSIDVVRSEHRGALGGALPSTVWPADGQAAVQVGPSQVQAGSNQIAAPIASLAKVMTAHLVLSEQLTELQALQALLLPSANNIAAVLARWDGGSAGRFVARMNATARSLGMTHTRYTDPSGYDDATVSTAADQGLRSTSEEKP